MIVSQTAAVTILPPRKIAVTSIFTFVDVAAALVRAIVREMRDGLGDLGLFEDNKSTILMC